MKKLLLGVIVVISLAAFALLGAAGPTVSMGVAWWGDEPVLAPGFGIKALVTEDVGGEFGLNFAAMDLQSGPDWEIEFGAFFEACLLTRLPSAEGGPYWNAIIGFGVPGFFHAEEGLTEFDGFGLGAVFGLSFESPEGHGVMIKTFWNGNIVGFGFVGYVDVFGFTGPAQTGP